jgi:hypothetical protein
MLDEGLDQLINKLTQESTMKHKSCGDLQFVDTGRSGRWKEKRKKSAGGI